MLGSASADSFAHLALANACVGVGSATALAGAGLYLADLSTPRNRAQTNAPVTGYQALVWREGWAGASDRLPSKPHSALHVSVTACLTALCFVFCFFFVACGVCFPLSRCPQVFQSALMGFAIGPLVGGCLASVVGFSWPFVVCSAALVASSAAAASLLPETMHDANRRQQPPPPHEGLGREQRAAAASLAEEVGTPALALQLARRPALQGLGPVVFMNGFGQGAMPVVHPSEKQCLFLLLPPAFRPIPPPFLSPRTFSALLFVGAQCP
jgi:MFS family permease